MIALLVPIEPATQTLAQAVKPFQAKRLHAAASKCLREKRARLVSVRSPAMIGPTRLTDLLNLKPIRSSFDQHRSDAMKSPWIDSTPAPSSSHPVSPASSIRTSVATCRMCWRPAHARGNKPLRLTRCPDETQPPLAKKRPLAILDLSSKIPC